MVLKEYLTITPTFLDPRLVGTPSGLQVLLLPVPFYFDKIKPYLGQNGLKVHQYLKYPKSARSQKNHDLLGKNVNS